MKSALRTSLLSGVFATGTLAMTMALSTAAHAQVTTSDIQGYIVGSNGDILSGATVSIANQDTGFSRTITTDSSGSFSARNLPVTGLYTVVVERSGFQGKRVEDIALTLGGTSSLSFVLDPVGGTVTDEIIVVGQRQVLADVALGPNANFGLATLENAPAINRNIADIVRIDPRVYVDESRGDINAVQCVGQSSRFNSITLDGVQLNDAFGLNANGYPTERMPFPFDALEQVSVEIAPYDVEYGGFTACNINAVTKSGTNSLSGGAFFDYTDDSLRGDKAKDVDLDFGNFDEIRYGVHLGGPIIKDRVFLFGAYEKLEGANVYSTNVIGTGPFQVSQAQLDEIASISQSVYQYDPGTTPSSVPNEDEKLLLKLDVNLTDNHRAAFTYNYNDGFNIVRSDGDSDEFEFSNHLYERGAELNAYRGALFSDWTENFSTEIRGSYQELDNRQVSVGGTDFGEMQVRVGDVTVYLGGDDSRQSNKLAYDVLNLAFTGNYDMDRHSITFGAERQELDIFNLFVQHTETEIRFNSIDDFRNQLAQRIYYNNAPSHDPNDAAAEWGYAQNTFFLQDEFELLDNLTLIAGVRYDMYESSDLPPTNPDFLADYGFSNAQNLDGVDLLQPRLGFSWDASDELNVRGGVGLYSGGNPNVWLSNNYSANNVTQFGQLARAGRGDFSDVSAIDLSALTYVAGEDGVPNGAGYAIPTIVFDPITNGMGSNFEINYLDPDFKIPSEWKYSLGFTWNPDFNTGEDLFGGRWQFTGDLFFSDGQDTAIVQRGDLVATGSQTVNGVTVPTYSSPLEDSFVLTNSSVGNEAFVASFGASKRWEHHGMTFGYAYSDAKDVQPMTSSVAFSNYNNRAYIDPQEQVLATSNYNIRHRFTASYDFSKDFIFDGYDTKLFIFGLANEGRPFSLVDDNPNDYYNFTPFLDGGGVLLPGTERNQFDSPWWIKADLRLEQELPGVMEGHNSAVFMVIDNITNLINSDWGVLEQASFPRTLTPGQPFALSGDASAYEIRFGARYSF